MATPLIYPEIEITERRRPAPWALPRPRIVATVNGPGEIAAWLFPFARALRERAPQARLTAVLLPCAFASGHEGDVLAEMREVDQIVSPTESMAWILRGITPLRSGRPDVVMHFGGELMLSVALARRLGVPLAAYEEERVRWSSLVDRTFVRDARAARGRESGRVRVVGNLMVDAARQRVPRRTGGNGRPRTVALFPGSRPYFVRQLLPLFLRMAASLLGARPGVRFVLAKSDFVTDDELRSCLTFGDDRIVPGDDGDITGPEGRLVIRSTRGVQVEVLSPTRAMETADVAVTIPGTNTAELASLGIPMLLVLPTYRLHTLPLPGLAGHLGGIPFFGPLIKEAVARSYVRTRRFWAHPNRLAGEALVPELIGALTAEGIAEALDGMLEHPLGLTGQRLQTVMGAEGASTRLVDEVLGLIDEHR